MDQTNGEYLVGKWSIPLLLSLAVLLVGLLQDHHSPDTHPAGFIWLAVSLHFPGTLAGSRHLGHGFAARDAGSVEDSRWEQVKYVAELG
ncbi:MAG: hypothetical protein A2Z16_01750 [Chloroflexi bacterium RBG_16_54_18]|nr:MAG: hypothetical protein A2Z16_01750 [Chloroflexi bacterium RBG_16_54_18]